MKRAIEYGFALCFMLILLGCFVTPSLKLQTSSSTLSDQLQKTKKSITIADFENNSLLNNLGGQSGSWNLTPDDSKVDVNIEVTPTGGAKGSKHALKLTYALNSEEEGSVGYWTKFMELDARAYDHLEFEVRGDKENEFSNIFLVEIKRYKQRERVDKVKGSFVVKGVTENWQTISIPLNLMTGLYDQTDPEAWKDKSLALIDFDELVVTLESRRVDKKQGALYLDNFRLVNKGNRGLTIMDQPEQTVLKTPVRLEGLEYAHFLLKRLKGFPKKVIVDKVFSVDDRAFLNTIAEDTWRFFDEIVDQEHQLPLDTIKLGNTEALSTETFIGDYTNVTNIGLYLMAVVSAYDLGFISREETVKRLKATLKTIRSLEHHDSGFLYNYYDTTTTQKTSYFISLVDNGWIDAGLYVVKNAFPDEFKEECEQMLSQHSFRFFYDDVSRQMTHGYFSHLNVKSDYLYGSFYTEPRAVSYIAIGRGDVPEEHWFKMVRTFPEEYSWQTQMPINRTLKTTLGFKYYGGYYKYKDIDFIPSWGGSTFEALMPTLIIDEPKLGPNGLGLNDKNQILGQMKYALEELKYPVWGMSPSSVPEGGYSEFGSKPMGSKGYKTGVVTPHATFLALPMMPDEAIKNARELLKRYPIYGEYGFYDAVTIETGLVARKYLALDQAMILISINNYLNHGAIRERFQKDAINKRMEALLKEENFFEKAEK